MSEIRFEAEDVLALAALANGIIPPDERDGGAACVHAGAVLAERSSRGPTGMIYAQGLRQATELSRDQFGRPITGLNPAEIHELLLRLAKEAPRFFRQLRADVCGLYLSDPGVWQRIGFPGSSIEKGGYPDFDQPQGRRQAN